MTTITAAEEKAAAATELHEARSARDREWNRYRPGKELVLFPYTPVEPWGRQYIDNPPPRDLPSGWIRDFNPHDVSEDEGCIRLRIERQLYESSDTYSWKSQVLLCDVIDARVVQESDYHAPIPSNTRVVAKVFDHVFYPVPHNQYKNADSNLAREAAAYKYLYQEGLTGYPHMSPQYYGSWATRFAVDKNEWGETIYRCVSMILMEYIDGASIEDICTRDKITGWLLLNHPKACEAFGTGLTKFTKPVRKSFMKKLIAGRAELLHRGIEHDGCEPRNIFITFRNGDTLLDEPRPVILGYTLAQIWHNTETAKISGEQHCLAMLHKPPHPYRRFNVESLEDFVGWFPSTPYRYCVSEKSYTGCFFDNKKEFDAWLVDEFGPCDDSNQFYSNPKQLDCYREDEEKAGACQRLRWQDMFTLPEIPPTPQLIP